jgi:hypothetical protein
VPPAQVAAQVARAPAWTDEVTFNLRPAEGVEWKLRAARGAQIRYSWRAQGGVVNYDLHGKSAAGGQESSYTTGRGVPGDEGVLTVDYDGTHGWFFRNRGNAPVTVVLRTSGNYTELRRM